MSFSRLLTLVLAVAISPVAVADVLFVDDDAPPAGDGASWETAHRFLAEALAVAANPAEGITEIRIAQGTYLPEDREDSDRECCQAHGGFGCDDPECEATVCGLYPDCCDLAWDDICVAFAEYFCPDVCFPQPDRSATFQLVSGVAVRGGYAGLGAPDPDARDIDLYETVLGGDLLGDDAPPWENVSDNSYHVLTASGVDETTVLDGITVTAAYADGTGADRSGAGLRNEGGNLALLNCTFVHNWAWDDGGGVANINADALIEGCVFLDNRAYRAGGAIHNQHSESEILGCLFTNNVGESGGAIHNVDCSPRVTDCTFTNDSSFNADYGGGIANVRSSPEIVECTFVGLRAQFGGGAIANGEESSPAIADCVFDGNATNGWPGGGAVYNDGSAEPSLLRCTFVGNVAGLQLLGLGSEPADGGAVCTWYGAGPTIVECSFEGNTAHDSGGAVGGPATIIDCTFVDNVATSRTGGAFYGSASTRLVRCTFRGNTASWGGAIGDWGWHTGSVSQCTFIGNTAANYGGGAVVTRGNSFVEFSNCLFAGNAATTEGGGAAVWANSAQAFVNCTMVDNTTAGTGGGVFVGPDPNTQDDHATADLVNCILWDNSDAGGDVQSAQVHVVASPQFTAAVDYSCVQGLDGSLGGVGNIGDDPAFTDPVGPDGTPGTGDEDLRLLTGSPAIDAGHNWAVAALADTDLDGNPRFAADEADFDPGCGIPVVVDMGAYEYQGDPFPVQLGDIDGNGTVNVNDFLLLLGAWGSCVEDCCLADLDLNGNVNVVDFLILLANWG
jgi:hypothetical protein